MDFVEGFIAAAQHNTDLMARVTDAQLEAVGPFRHWTARDLINHLIAGAEKFRAAATGDVLPNDGAPTAPRNTTDNTGGDAIAAYRAAVAAAADAFANPELRDRTVALPTVTVPGRMVAGIAFLEQVTHGWDLAVATGQDREIDPRFVDVLIPVAEQLLDQAVEGVNRFVGATSVPPDATPTVRLLVLAGRDPVG